MTSVLPPADCACAPGDAAAAATRPRAPSIKVRLINMAFSRFPQSWTGEPGPVARWQKFSAAPSRSKGRDQRAIQDGIEFPVRRQIRGADADQRDRVGDLLITSIRRMQRPAP